MGTRLETSVAAARSRQAAPLLGTLAIGLSLALLAACGQKGALTLPKPAAGASAPAPGR